MSAEHRDGAERSSRLAEKTRHQIVLFSGALLEGALVVSILLGAAAGDDQIGAGLTAFLIFTGAAAAAHHPDAAPATSPCVL